MKNQGHWNMSRKPKTKKIPWRIKVIETCPGNLKQESLISQKIEVQAQRQGQEKKDWKTGLFEACLKTTYAN